MTILLDASYFLALVNSDDVHHAKAKEIAQAIDLGEYGLPCTTNHVADEVISVALRKWGKEKAVYAGKSVLERAYLLISDEHIFNSTWSLFQHTDGKYSFTDCISLITSGTFQIEFIATFDKEFKKTDFAVIGI